jgi:hypothetical protein
VIVSVHALRANPSLLKDLAPKPEECAVCHEPLQEAVTGKRPTADGNHCSDCHYEAAGEIVEAAPIVTARVRRG